ncbi:MAG TPA: NAD(P)H-binding protein [Vicinamibacterales bacterium]|nr:NAD(P)H-binding protein [Vicinamibacterales bacterium]
MSNPRLTVLVVGASGSIGRLVVEEAVRKSHAVQALARDPRKAGRLFPDVEGATPAIPATGSSRVASSPRCTAAYWYGDVAEVRTQ